jgi:hypothetical protein
MSVAARGPAGAVVAVASACADVSVSPSEPAEHAASIADKASRPAIAFVLTINSPVASLLAPQPMPYILYSVESLAHNNSHEKALLSHAQ